MNRTPRILVTAIAAVAAVVLGMTTVPAAGATPGPLASAPLQAGQANPANAVAPEIEDPAADDELRGPEATQTMGGGLGTSGAYAATPYYRAPAVNTTGGNMFDTCDTPSLAAMKAWTASPYHTVGIYIGGSVRGCKTQKNLTPSWIIQTTTMGWNHVPIYVGLQAPCTTVVSSKSWMSSNEATAAAQGRAAALDGMVQMRRLGIGANVPLYLDMEHYSIKNGTCSVAVHAFTDAWTRTLHAAGYLSGIYGSASSMIHHLQAWVNAGNYARPDKVWFARWNGKADAEEVELDKDAWIGDRIHQFTGGHLETWGGVTINIDSNYVQSFSTTPSYVGTVTPTIAWDSQTAKVGTKPIALAIAGKFGVPANASAVVLNVQIANPTGSGDLIVEPYRSNTTLATQQFTKGQYVSTTVVVPVSRKVVQFRTTANHARIIVGVTGYLTSTGTDGITATPPRILWDSKTATVAQDPVGLAVRGVGPIPADASAVILNVQVAHPTSSGQLIVEPHQVHSTIGMQQYTKGRSISATVIVPLIDGGIQFRLSSGQARVIVSTLGYLSPTASGRLTATTPTLLWDSRTPKASTKAAGFRVAGRNEIPANATAAVLNVQVVNPAAAGQLIVEGYGTRSNSGVQQFVKGQSISTTVLVPLVNGAAQLRLSAGKARVIVSSVGYVTDYVAPPTDEGTGDDGTDGDTGESTDGSGT